MAIMPEKATLNIDPQELWSRYEDIAMHFNDLLMRLRSQSVTGIAAVSTLVGLFSKEGIADVKVSWLAATAIFVAMALFWVAIWCLDFLYYNRLLSGAVSALTDLEAQIKGGPVNKIEMSTTVEAEFKKPLRIDRFKGILCFYGIVLLVIIAGAIFSALMYKESVRKQTQPVATHAVSKPAGAVGRNECGNESSSCRHGRSLA